MAADLFLVEDCLWIAAEPVGLPLYDFDFAHFLAVRHPWERPDEIEAIARIGAIADYDARHTAFLDEGVRLIHDPATYRRAAQLSQWYPVIADLTARTRIFPELPAADEIEAGFDWPVFVKGDRQTSRHEASFSIFRSRADYEAGLSAMRGDRILGWQSIAVREFLDLRPAGKGAPGKIPPSFEFRTFWWRGSFVGAGPYWRPDRPYRWTDAERDAALAVAGEAARRLAVPFLSVDMAQTRSGRWVVIEVNDGQESGYCNASPLGLWQRIVAVERQRRGAA